MTEAARGRRALALSFALALAFAFAFALAFTASSARAADPTPPPASAAAGATVPASEPYRLLWNVSGQTTWLSSVKLPFDAPYTNLNGNHSSITPELEHSFTWTLTLYLGTTLWRGAELHWVPEVIASRPLSQLQGLGGAIQNFELQKSGSETPTLYSSRLFLRQTFNLGGETVAREAEPMQLAIPTQSRRLVLTLGNFSILDIFDKNAYAGDLRRQFFNMSFMTHAAYDFAADARGYTWGAALEFHWGDWAIRIAHTIAPDSPNQLPLNYRFWEYYGDQLEVEHRHTVRGLSGAVRLLGYRNHENMALFKEALNAWRADPAKSAAACTTFHYDSANATAPDVCWARRPNVKWGVGLNVEQAISKDIGVFLRAMVSDGLTEVYSYTSTDMSLSFGALARGSLWHRPDDYAGIGFSVGWISQIHADYLAAGGVDGFIGDGRLRQAAESVFEVFYGVHLWRAIWASADYQLLTNPAFNADRGPVHVLGLRLHAEF